MWREAVTEKPEATGCPPPQKFAFVAGIKPEGLGGERQRLHCLRLSAKVMPTFEVERTWLNPTKRWRKPNRTKLMKTMQTLLLFFLLPLAALRGKDAKPALYIPEGQLLSQPVMVYVANTNLAADSEPMLLLTGLHAITQPTESEEMRWTPRVVAPGQDWTEVVAGKTIAREGTLLIFDLNAYQVPWFKAAIRLNPSLSWNPGSTNQNSTTPPLYGHSVYLGRISAAIFWTFIVVGTLVTLIWVWSVRKKQSAVYLISGEDGYLSLWRTQLVAWTLAVGSLVFCFGLIRLEVPHIPETLVALMGMSVATGGLSSMSARSLRRAQLRDGLMPKPNPESPHLSDLISSYSSAFHEVELSVPKAQMVFWTGIILVLFVAKSLLMGGLWEVPWEMVALTGVSQIGYVTDKAAKQHPAHAKPAKDKTETPAEKPHKPAH
jgi:hypothetical protein